MAGLGLAFGACDSPLTSIAKEGLEPFDPLPEYAGFWEATETCSGTSGDLGLIRWFRALSLTSNGQILRGLWEPPHRITIWTGLEDDEPTVRHEMLHDLLRGDPNHRAPAWGDCGLELP